MAAGDILHVAGSLSPSRNAAKFIATADEAVVIDQWAVDRVAAGDAVGTITAWINVPDITGDYGIISAGDTAAIEFLTLRITSGKLVVELNDATVDKFEHTSTNVVVTPHKWMHVAVVQDGVKPRLFVNGARVAQSQTLGTDNTLWFGALALTDDASIGAAEEAGAAAQIREFKGAISDIKYWNAALTDAQIKQDYEGRPPATINANLLDWWDFRDDCVNSVDATHNGTAGASIKLCNQYSEFTSRLAFLGQVVADNTVIGVNEREGHCVVVKNA